MGICGKTFDKFMINSDCLQMLCCESYVDFQNA